MQLSAKALPHSSVRTTAQEHRLLERALKARLNPGCCFNPKTFVILDAVFAQQFTVFFLKGATAMVFLLVLPYLFPCLSDHPLKANSQDERTPFARNIPQSDSATSLNANRPCQASFHVSRRIL